MTEAAKRPTWIRTTAVVAIIALVVGVGGGWLIFKLTSSSESSTPSSVWLLRADQSTLVQGDDGAILAITNVGPQVAKYDLESGTITELVAAVDFFNNWEARFGDETQRAAFTGIAGAEQIEFSAEISDAVWDAGANSVTFRADNVEGAGQLDVLLEVTVAIEGS